MRRVASSSESSWENAELVLMENMQDRYHERDPFDIRRTASNRLTMHPLKLNDAVDRAGGLLVIWHSHCEVGAYFSEEDVRWRLERKRATLARDILHCGFMSESVRGRGKVV